MVSEQLNDPEDLPATDPVDAFLAYPFSTDAVYQQGLDSITASGAFEGKSEEERAALMRSSQVYYFSRATGCSITVDDVLQRERARQLGSDDLEAAQTSLTAADQPRTLSFAELKALIEEGKTDQIPNNRQIPNVLNPAAPSQSIATARKKPWEADK
ncbi:hypothetical protein FOMPIDRAFT_1132628 [Fomitopsis schrenkii]|uniref:Uncharacterized protein n=1 Tax=Fomitopsis schrenkii TaxID=2126942 RepID=S8F9L9_FOMSC|nr:hypothetical protein FOMPIDRAFT_1132628 [Fomitopsis schrenkii]